MKTDFSALVAAAEAAGLAAGEAAVPTPMVVSESELFSDKPKAGGKSWYVSEGACGFAWVHFKGNTDFGRWMKKNGKARPDYPKGLCVWVSYGNQSVARKEAYADAYAGVLKAAGITCYSASRLD